MPQAYPVYFHEGVFEENFDIFMLSVVFMIVIEIWERP